MNRIMARIAASAAAFVVATAAAVAIAAPAQAAPPGCSQGLGHYEQAGNYITVYHYWFCDDGNDIPLGASIQRYLSPGVYETVASGSGEVTYYCAGSAYNVYRTTGSSDFGILCS